MRSKRRGISIAFIIIGVLVLAVAYLNRSEVRDWAVALTRPALPSAQPHATPTRSPGVSATQVPATATPRPTAVNLAVPFVPQAPYQVWDLDHEEFCEEASVLMVVSYVHADATVTDKAVAEADLQDIKSWELAHIGFFEDTTAAQTLRIITEKYNVAQAHLVYNPTVQQLKDFLLARKAVIVPSAGRLLGNPNFSGIGPLYHMLVLKGFTADGQFVTNDPGTRKGADYRYTADVIMNAMHDWNNGDVNNGAKVVIVVG